MSIEHTFTIVPQGPFSLAEAGLFGRGDLGADSPGGIWAGAGAFTEEKGVLRLAFCLDGLRAQVGVALTQDSAGVHGVVTGLPPGDDVAAVRAQVARMLSLDADASGLTDVAARDPVVGRVLAAAPGLRPVLFPSPYEAALWCVITQRWGTRQALAARERLARTIGQVLPVAGVDVPAMPMPAQLLAAGELPGLPAVKQERLRSVAKAAVAGVLEPAALRDGETEEVRARLREIPGLGPFAATLIHLRATGVRDVLVDAEPRLAALVGALYELGTPAAPADLARIAQAWQPYRTWVAVIVRAAGRRLPQLRDLPEPSPPRNRTRQPPVQRVRAPRARLALVD